MEVVSNDRDRVLKSAATGGRRAVPLQPASRITAVDLLDQPVMGRERFMQIPQVRAGSRLRAMDVEGGEIDQAARRKMMPLKRPSAASEKLHS